MLGSTVDGSGLNVGPGDHPLPEGVIVRRVPYGVAGVPRLSIIIPTRDGRRRGLLGSLLSDLQLQTLGSFEVLLVIGDRRQGRAINRGVSLAQADVIATMDDDTVLGPADLLQRLLDTLASDPQIGMVGASTVVPRGASRFQHAACRQIPRRFFPIQSEVVDSDMVQHPCLVMRRDRFLEIGGEDEELIRGLDPLLRWKVRERGWRVVIAPGCWVGHPLPEGFGKVVRMYYRNGRGSAFAQRHYPDRVYQLDGGDRGDRFAAKCPLWIRAIRHPGRLVSQTIRGHFIGAAAQLAYLAGFSREWVAGERPEGETDEDPS